jgi:hypothetical protein
MTFKKIILLLGLPGPPRLRMGDSNAKAGQVLNFNKIIQNQEIFLQSGR